jgi:hypothetical protein
LTKGGISLVIIVKNIVFCIQSNGRGVKKIAVSGRREGKEEGDIPLPSPGLCDILKVFNACGLLPYIAAKSFWEPAGKGKGGDRNGSRSPPFPARDKAIAA